MKRKQDNLWVMEQAPVGKALLSLAIPTMLGMLVHLIYNITDTFFVGMMGDYVQLAAVSLTMPVTMVTGGLAQLFGGGAPAVISRLLGQGRRESARRASAVSLYLTAAIGAAASIGALIAINPILKAISATGATYGPTRTYLTIVLAGTGLAPAPGAMQALLRTEGAAKQAAFGSALGVVLNIALDPLLILALDMGIAGAAVATVLGNGASLLYFIVAIRRKAAAVSISPRDFRPERESLKDMLALGAPSFLGQAAMGVAMLFANSFCMGYSVQTMTASNIAGKAYSVVVMLVMGISMGVQPFLGYNYGKGAKERLRKGLFWGIGMSTGLCLLASAFFLLGGEWFVRLFTGEPEVIAIGERCVKAFLVSTPFLGLQMLLLSYLQATGKNFGAMVVNLGRQFLVFFPLMVLLNHFFQVEGMIYTQPISDLVTTALAMGFALAPARGKREKAIAAAAQESAA